MVQEVDNHLKSSWDDSIKNSKSRDADFDTLSGHRLDLCYFPKIIDFHIFSKVVIDLHNFNNNVILTSPNDKYFAVKRPF